MQNMISCVFSPSKIRYHFLSLFTVNFFKFQQRFKVSFFTIFLLNLSVLCSKIHTKYVFILKVVDYLIVLQL